MAIFSQLTEQNIADRFFLLPKSLQDALEDRFTFRALGEICAQAGVADESVVSGAADAAAAVLLGFLHPDDLAGTLQDEIGIPEEEARAIALNAKAALFAPVLEDIQSSYSPLLEEKEEARAVPMPAMMPVAATPAAGAAMAAAKAALGGPGMVLKIPAAPVKPPAPAVPAPKPVSLDSFARQPQAPAGIPTSPAAAPRFSMPSAPAATPASLPKIQPGSPGPAPAPSAPAPFIMHQESVASPLAAAGSGFKLNVPSDIFKSASPAKKIDIPPPPRVAELEIGRAPAAPKPPIGPMTTASAPARVVHYSDFRTSVAPGFAAAQPFQPKPAAPAQPPTMPVPSKLPTAPAALAPKPPMAPASSAPAAMPAAPKPGAALAPGTPVKPKVVNFGPEEVK